MKGGAFYSRSQAPKKNAPTHTNKLALRSLAPKLSKQALLRCLLVITKHDNSTQQVRLPRAWIESGCGGGIRVIVVCMGSAPPHSACTLRLANNGLECHSLLHVIVAEHARFANRSDPWAFDRLVSAPATAARPDNRARYLRLGQIVREPNQTHYLDALGRGHLLRPNFTVGVWKGVKLTPAEPRGIGRWIERWLPGTRVCKTFQTQGIFSVGGALVGRQPRRFYEHLLEQVATCGVACQVCHYMERLWHAIFRAQTNGPYRLCDDFAVHPSQCHSGCGEVVGR